MWRLWVQDYRQYAVHVCSKSYLGELFLEAKCLHGWIQNSTQNPEFHKYTFLNPSISQCLLTHVMSESHVTSTHKERVSWDLAFCPDFSLRMFLQHVSSFLFSTILPNFFAQCILLTFWHTNHSAERARPWSGPTGSDSCASEIRFLCVFTCHCAFFQLSGQKGGVLTFSRSARTCERQFQTSDRVMDEGSEGHQSSAEQN